MQVLSLFAGARVPWPPIMLDIFIYLRLFSIDIDLAAPECFLRELVTFEYKFFLMLSKFFIQCVSYTLDFISNGIVPKLSKLVSNRNFYNA